MGRQEMHAEFWRGKLEENVRSKAEEMRRCCPRIVIVFHDGRWY